MSMNISGTIKNPPKNLIVKEYEILEAEYIEEIDSFAMRLLHKKSGAKLIFLSNDNPYKVFNISFLTPIKNNSGIPHMLEHCVLAGSRKYPTGYYEKLNNRLSPGEMNAGTTIDHTYFYCIANSPSDFRTCIDLHMDSVFYPKVYEDENIFKREGWRIEYVNDEESSAPYVQYNGIVLNEMKANDNNYLRHMLETAFKEFTPDSVYGYRPGGKSYKIPQCSYEDLLAYHKKYYQPSNACLYLYGDFMVEDTLRYLDQEYLCKFTGKHPVSLLRIPCEKKYFRICQKTFLTDQEEEPVYQYICLFPGKVSPDQALAFELFKNEIEEIIAHDLDELGLSCEASCYFDHSGVQDYLAIYLFGIQASSAGKTIKKAIKHTLKSHFEDDDLFRVHLIAKLNRYELNFWEEMHSKNSAGMYLFRMLENYWYYNEHYVFETFQISDHLQYVKNRIWGHCYNTMVTKAIPENSRELLIEFVPKNKGEDFFAEKLQKNLDKKLKHWSDSDFEHLLVENEQYADWEINLEKNENEKNTALHAQNYENLLSGLKESKISYQTEEVNGIPIYHILEKQSKAVWLCLNFQADDFREHISELKLLVSFINNRDFGQFYGIDSRESKTFLTNYMVAELVINRDFNAPDAPCHINIDVSTCVLEENIPDAIQLIHRMLFDILIAIPNFEDSLKIRIQDLKEEFCLSPEEYHLYLAGSTIDDRCYLLDQTSGLGYYNFLKKLREGGDKALKRFYKNCYAMINKIFVNDRLTVFCNATEHGLLLVKKTLGLTSLSEVRDVLQKNLKRDYNAAIKTEKNYECRMELKKWKKFVLEYHSNLKLHSVFEHENIPDDNFNLAVIIPSHINYIVFYGSATNRFDYKEVNQGALKLISDILEDRYLRRELREHGGAYGFNISIYTSGKLCISTYRDPHLKRTMQIIRESADFIRNIKMSEEELWNYKSTRLNEMLDNMDNDPWGDQEAIRSIELKGLTANFDEKTAEQICHCTMEDIHHAADWIETMLSNGRFCVFGSKSSIKKRESLFGQIVEIMENT